MKSSALSSALHMSSIVKLDSKGGALRLSQTGAPRGRLWENENLSLKLRIFILSFYSHDSHIFSCFLKPWNQLDFRFLIPTDPIPQTLSLSQGCPEGISDIKSHESSECRAVSPTNWACRVGVDIRQPRAMLSDLVAGASPTHSQNLPDKLFSEPCHDIIGMFYHRIYHFFFHFHIFPCGSLPPLFFFPDFHLLLLLKYISCEANSQELHQVGGTDHHIFIGTYG